MPLIRSQVSIGRCKATARSHQPGCSCFGLSLDAGLGQLALGSQCSVRIGSRWRDCLAIFGAGYLLKKISDPSFGGVVAAYSPETAELHARYAGSPPAIDC